MSWDDDSHGSDAFRYLSAFVGFGSYGRLKPMSAYGRVDARLKEGDSNFKRDEEAISEELTAALKRIAITSARAA